MIRFIPLILSHWGLLQTTSAFYTPVKGQQNAYTFGSVIPLQGQSLTGTPLKTEKLPGFISCLLDCFMNVRCMSVNFNETVDIYGLFGCELLDFDKYEFGQNVRHVSDVTHYALPYNALPDNCAVISKEKSQASGVYRIKPSSLPSFYVYCDMITSGGGWTVIQRRLDGTVNFYRGWADYKRGFGNENSEYWLGLDRIHVITSRGKYRLRVDLEDFEGSTRYAEYRSFRVDDEAENYRLFIDNYTGNALDSLKEHNGMSFSTKDRDNDIDGARSCAVTYTGAWWYMSCHHSNLNGLYLRGSNNQFGRGVIWYYWKKHYYSLKRTEMKIKPRD